jgi:hypothetical protein
MNKHPIIFIVGISCALALTLFPSMASAGEFVGHCSSGPGTTCTATFAAGTSTLEDDSGSRLECTSTTGSVTGTSGTSTGTASLTAHGCKDEATGFTCTSVGEPVGTLHTGSGLVSHLVYIDATPSTLVGILATNLNITITCAGGLIKKTVTGSVIAVIQNPECGKPRASFKGEFSAGVTTGSQRYTQVTTTGTVFNLIFGNETADTTQTSITGSGTITVNEGKTITLTC